MSDSQKFGGPSLDVVDQPIPEQLEASASRFNPRVMLVAGAVVVVLAVAAYFLLFAGGGGTDSTSGGLVSPAPHSSTAPSKAASAAPTLAPAVAGTGLSSNGRDPFQPLVTASNPTPAASTNPTTAATTPGGTTTPVGVKSTLKVNSVNFATNSANVVVDGKPYIAYAGQLFAKYYTLKVVISGSSGCAVFNFGDLPAQLCNGQSATFTG